MDLFLEGKFPNAFSKASGDRQKASMYLLCGSRANESEFGLQLLYRVSQLGPRWTPLVRGKQHMHDVNPLWLSTCGEIQHSSPSIRKCPLVSLLEAAVYV